MSARRELSAEQLGAALEIREPTEALSFGGADADVAPPLEPVFEPARFVDGIDGGDERDAHAAPGFDVPRDRVTVVDGPPLPRQLPMRRAGILAGPSMERAARPPTDEPEERLGDTLGSYRLLELIGKGGMGYVYRAEHIRLGREVALKLLRSDYSRRRDAVARFFQEARTVNRISHRNIVDVTDFFGLDDGTTFIIMELLRGRSLGAWARSGFDVPRALGLLIQICDGLAAAHTVGVIHRDLKPDNVFVVRAPDGEEQVRLLDFGVAKLLNRDDEDLGIETAAGSVVGTPAYMSPEQAGGMRVDARSDIYSLGAIMYELFCGQPMFRGKSFGEYVRKHLNVQPTPPRQTAGGAMMSERLEAVILRCLQKSVERRYPTIEALRDDLVGLLCQHDSGLINARDLGGIPGSVRRGLSALRGLAPFRSPGPTGSGLDLDEGVRTSIAVAPRRWPWLAGVVGLATAAVAIGVLVGSGGPSGAGRAAGALPAAATAPIATPVLAPPTPAPIPSPAPTVDPAEPAPPKAIAREPRGEREIRRDDARGRGEKAKTRRGDRRRAADDRGRAKRAATAPVVKPAAAIEPPAPPPSPPPANSDKPTRPARVDPTDTLDPFR